MDAYRDQYATLFHGGARVVLLPVSVDAPALLAEWAGEQQYPFSLLSDSGGVVGRRYGAWEPEYQLDNRTVFVVGPDGRIAYVAAPFSELDPTAYQDLKAAIERVRR